MRIEQNEFVIDKWGYAILAGVIGLAAASSPDGFSPNAGFALCFLATYFGLIVLEVLAQKAKARRLKSEGLELDFALATLLRSAEERASQSGIASLDKERAEEALIAEIVRQLIQRRKEER